MGWTWLPSVSVVTFELPFLSKCSTNIHSSLRRAPLLWMGGRWSVCFACLPLQVMGHVPQDPEESVRLAHPPLTPPLKDGEISCVCVCGHLYAWVEMLSHACILLSALSVHTCMVCVQSASQRGQLQTSHTRHCQSIESHLNQLMGHTRLIKHFGFVANGYSPQ